MRTDERSNKALDYLPIPPTRTQCPSQLIDVLVPGIGHVQDPFALNGRQIREVKRARLSPAEAAMHDREHRTADDRAVHERARVEPDHRLGVMEGVEVFLLALAVGGRDAAPGPDSDSPRFAQIRVPPALEVLGMGSDKDADGLELWVPARSEPLSPFPHELDLV